MAKKKEHEMMIFHSDWHKFRGKFITPKELAYRWGVPEDKLENLIGDLIRTKTIDGEARYDFFDIINFENWFYFTKEDLAKRWNIPEDKLENLIGDLIRTETIDGEAAYPILRVITFEKQNLIKQEEFAKIWDIPFYEVKKIDEFDDASKKEHDMTTTPDKKFFAPEELIKRWCISEDEFKNLKQKLIPIKNTMLDRYTDDYILKFERWYYLTKEQLVKRWGGREDWVDQANIKSNKIDEKDCYKFFDVLNSEYSFLFTQNQLAERWEVPFDDVRKIDRFVSFITIDGEVYYPSITIIEYEKRPILLAIKE